MPLSKARNRERMREQMRVKRQMLQPSSHSVIPDWVLHPNPYLLGHLSVCPDFNPVRPSDHFDHCPYINPLYVRPNMLQPKSDSVIPKLPWYAGAGAHFGEVRNEYYAKQFFSSLFQT